MNVIKMSKLRYYILLEVIVLVLGTLPCKTVGSTTSSYSFDPKVYLFFDKNTDIDKNTPPVAYLYDTTQGQNLIHNVYIMYNSGNVTSLEDLYNLTFSLTPYVYNKDTYKQFTAGSPQQYIYPESVVHEPLWL